MSALAVEIPTTEQEGELPKLRSFSASRKALLKEVEIAAAVVEKKTTIPILSNLSLALKGRKVTITGTDLELGIVTACEVTNVSPGKAWAITLPAKQLVATLKSMSGEQVTFTAGDAHTAAIQCGGSSVQLAGMSAESFPELPKAPDPVVTLDAVTLADAIRRTAFAISHEESRLTLNGSLLHITGGKARMVATDGRRLAFKEWECDGELRALIPKAALLQVAKVIGKYDGPVLVSADENHVFFDNGRQVISRKLSGNFPDYERVMWTKDEDHIRYAAIVDCDAFAKSIQRASKYADKWSRCVHLTLCSEGIKVYASTVDAGEYKETISAVFSFVPQRKCKSCKRTTLNIEIESCELMDDGKTCGGELESLPNEITVAYNHTYLTDMLSAATEDQVAVLIESASMATELRAVGNPSWRVVVMLMKI